MKKYPVHLFIIGCLMNFIKNFYLLLPGIILMIAGIWSFVCLFIGLALLICDIIVSFTQQVLIRKATMTPSDNPDFQEFQDAILSGENWCQNIQNLVDEKVKDNIDDSIIN